MIKEENYTSIDITLDCIEAGKKEFPNAEFIYYNCYNYMYNHNGYYFEKFPEIKNHDYIFSYSVFSHTDLITMINSIRWMLSLNPKKIIFSYLDIDNVKLKNYFYNRRIQQYGSCIDFRNINTNMYYVIDNNEIIKNTMMLIRKDCQQFIALYNTEWLINQLSLSGFNAKYVTTKHTGIPFIEIS
jgi:hypothetical protein